jgi:hypothetical protein
LVVGCDYAKRFGFNEGKACDAVVRHLEARIGATRQGVAWPEKDGHAAPIELTCSIGGAPYAFEHTGIEPFAGHVQLNVDAELHLAPIDRMLVGALPPTEDFELHIPIKAMEGMSQRNARRVQEAIVGWVRQCASTLQIAKIGRRALPIRWTAIPGVPFEVALHRSEPLFGAGRFRIAHVIRESLEEYRDARVREACERKYSKLAAWKAKGARTVFVLEENDIQTTNVHLVTDSVLAAEKTVPQHPDEIYLVSSAHDPWWLCAVRVDDRWFFDVENPDERAWEIDPAHLVAITGR